MCQCNFYVFVSIISLLLLLISSFIKWSEKVLDMISTFLNFLRPVLCPKIYCILGNIHCMLERNICFWCYWMECSVYVCQVFLSIVFFKNSVSSLFFFLSKWSIHCWKWDIYFPTSYTSSFNSINICFKWIDAPILVTYIFTTLISSW